MALKNAWPLILLTPNCEPDYCIVVSKSRERLLVTSEEIQKFCVDIFNLKKPNHVKLKSSTVDSNIIEVNRTKV
jgi:hypothetical protein